MPSRSRQAPAHSATRQPREVRPEDWPTPRQGQRRFRSTLRPGDQRQAAPFRAVACGLRRCRRSSPFAVDKRLACRAPGSYLLARNAGTSPARGRPARVRQARAVCSTPAPHRSTLLLSFAPVPNPGRRLRSFASQSPPSTYNNVRRTRHVRFCDKTVRPKHFLTCGWVRQKEMGDERHTFLRLAWCSSRRNRFGVGLVTPFCVWCGEFRAFCAWRAPPNALFRESATPNAFSCETRPTKRTFVGSPPHTPSSNGVRRRRLWPSRPSSMTHT